MRWCWRIRNYYTGRNAAERRARLNTPKRILRATGRRVYFRNGAFLQADKSPGEIMRLRTIAAFLAKTDPAAGFGAPAARETQGAPQPQPTGTPPQSR